jgi:hypothetical protein
LNANNLPFSLRKEKGKRKRNGLGCHRICFGQIFSLFDRRWQIVALYEKKKVSEKETAGCACTHLSP